MEDVPAPDLVKVGTKDGRLHLQLESWFYDYVTVIVAAIERARDLPVNARITAPAADFGREMLDITLSLPQFGFTITVCAFAAAEFIVRKAITVGRKTTINVPTTTTTVTAHPPE
ncbi:hypothetical protein [Natrialba swarupiae]|uniref:Uncharacterized protein n=1 Tax=Natrialba swarupiae TaxID=2448032 RepID=A0A5D5AGE5_9EURY|nr:hypothetical protein [Natrialba swarupiae]TYT60869.1 hypothetical protein FYC77_16715 [Natrialba swarupiae]